MEAKTSLSCKCRSFMIDVMTFVGKDAPTKVYYYDQATRKMHQLRWRLLYSVAFPTKRVLCLPGTGKREENECNCAGVFHTFSKLPWFIKLTATQVEDINHLSHVNVRIILIVCSESFLPSLFPQRLYDFLLQTSPQRSSPLSPT